MHSNSSSSSSIYVLNPDEEEGINEHENIENEALDFDKNWWIMRRYTSYSLLHSSIEESRQKLGDSGENCYAYRSSPLKTLLFYLLNLILLGTPYLVTRWYPQFKIYFTSSISSLRTATSVLIEGEDGWASVNVQVDGIEFLPDEFRQGQKHDRETSSPKTPMLSTLNCSVFRHFNYRNEKFVWDDSLEMFRKLRGLDGLTCTQILKNTPGLTSSKRQQLITVYGRNEIRVESRGYFQLLIEEVLNPFYVFQIFSITLWCFDNYYYYAACVAIISAISILITLRETRQQIDMLRDMAFGAGDFIVTIKLPNGEEEEISTCDLVPGDILLIPSQGFIMPCDAVVTHGTCIVNESMLTGESVPVRKIPLNESEEIYDSESHKRHTLFSGTQVIQTRFYAGEKISCVVVRTGFNTLKGSLIRSMMFPKDDGLDFYKDAMKFVLVLCLVALGGMTFCTYLYIKRGASWDFLVVRVLDIVTIVVPPALPAALTVGIVYAQARLKLKQIFCISPPKINHCGKLKLICFDKTGTLTEDGLDLSSVVPCTFEQESSFLDPVTEISTLSPTSPLLLALASCHSLTYIQGKLIGDPLDLKMFEATQWELEEPENSRGGDSGKYNLLVPNIVKKDGSELAIIRELEFTPQLQRMSVVVTSLTSPSMTLFCKGAPEKVRPLCGNVPHDFDLVLDSFTLRGFRVLAFGWKEIQGLPWHHLQRISRDDLETDLTFCGFLVMQNSLKPATIPVINELKEGGLRSVMVTGDNALTALSVARECGMIPSCDKVIIVNASEDGKIEYTLAAHHYEVGGDEGEESGISMSSPTGEIESKNTKIIDQRISMPLSDLSSDDEEQHLLTTSPHLENIRKMSVEETQIDVERLVPIAGMSPYMHLDSFNYHFVLTGKSWSALNQFHPKSTIEKILAKGTVFARMSPECKKQLVEAFQSINYVVGMVGDGANDCSALKMAHVGISLSEAEASVAAPFTSKIPDISCVPHLIREGRCALVTSFGMFKYMALYSIVQFITVITLYYHYANLADSQFLYGDLFVTTTIAIVMGRTEAYGKIVQNRPLGSLASAQNILSLLSQIIIIVIVQLFAIIYLERQPWFIPNTPQGPDDVFKLSWETTTLFIISSFQYIILAIVCSAGKPFRKPFYTNKLFMLAITVLTTLTILLTIYPFMFLSKYLVLVPIEGLDKRLFRITLLLFPLIQLIVASSVERMISGGKPIKKALSHLGVKRKSKYRYEEILKEIEGDKSWPLVKASSS